MSKALATDLLAAGKGDGWRIGCGIASNAARPNGFTHSWITFDGWIVDASNGGFFVLTSEVYAATLAPRDVGTFELADLASWWARVEAIP